MPNLHKLLVLMKGDFWFNCEAFHEKMPHNKNKNHFRVDIKNLQAQE